MTSVKITQQLTTKKCNENLIGLYNNSTKPIKKYRQNIHIIDGEVEKSPTTDFHRKRKKNMRKHFSVLKEEMKIYVVPFFKQCCLKKSNKILVEQK